MHRRCGPGVKVQVNLAGGDSVILNVIGLIERYTMNLRNSQSEAIRHVDALTASRTTDVESGIRQSLDQALIPVSLFSQAACALRTEARVELSFHPDRRIASGANVAEELLRDGIYRNQFETAISNGSRSAHSGGNRQEWEQRMFGGVYERCAASERPKYGALNICGYSDGSAPRFGSCYLGLRPQVSERTTFSYGDSATDPCEIGTLHRFDLIWLAIFRDVLNRGNVLALPRSTLSTLLTRVRASCTTSSPTRFRQSPGRALDNYIEAQVHGDIRLDRDVEFIVVDPSFARSKVGTTLECVSRKYGFPLYYHKGFVVDVGEISDDFRGPEIPKLAMRIARASVISAKDIGDAAESLHSHPEVWCDWGTVDETLQHIKQLWHVLVQYGRPVAELSDHDVMHAEPPITHSKMDNRPRRPGDR